MLQRMTRSDQGFSLPEMLVSLALLGVAAGIGFYTVNTGSWRASAAASELSQRLEYARTRAVLDGHNYVVTFSSAANTYTIVKDINNDGDHDPGIGETQNSYTLSTSGSGVGFDYLATADGLDGAAMSSAVTFAGSPPKLTFTRLGTSNTGTIYLIPAEDHRDSYPGHMRAITVAGATARIRRWEYHAASASPGPWRLDQ